MMASQLVTRTFAIQWETALVLILGTLIILNITDLDISFHGNYVGKLIEICHPNNQSQECTEFRQHLGVPMTGQIQLGDAYWAKLNEQPIWIGVIMVGIRLGFAIILHYKLNYRIRPFTIMMIIMYGMIGANLFYFALIDSLYYTLQQEPIPQQLPWLDGVGIFQETKTWYGDPNHVDYMDLLATNLIGIVLIGGFIFSTMLIMAYSGSSRAIA